MNIDKKSITEIKQLADSGEIDLNSLSHEDLQAVFDEEMRAQLESKTYDMTFLNKVAEALGKTDPPNFPSSGRGTIRRTILGDSPKIGLLPT